MPQAKFITKKLLEEVFGQYKEEWLRKYLLPDKRVAAAIVALDPATPFGSIDFNPPPLWVGILGEQDPAKWPEDRYYDKFAYTKALAAWRTRMPNNEMLMNPELIVNGDFLYEGGIFVAGGWALGVSGLAKAPDDTLLAGEFARAVHNEVVKLFEAAKAKAAVKGAPSSTFYA